MYVKFLHVILGVKHGLSCKLSCKNAVWVTARCHNTARSGRNFPGIAVYIRVYDNVVNSTILWRGQDNRHDVVQQESLGINAVARAVQGLGLTMVLFH